MEPGVWDVFENKMYELSADGYRVGQQRYLTKYMLLYARTLLDLFLCGTVMTPNPNNL